MTGKAIPKMGHATPVKKRWTHAEEAVPASNEAIAEADKGGDMAKPASSQQAGEERSGMPALQTPSQVQER
jgi:hypothetical protein